MVKTNAPLSTSRLLEGETFEAKVLQKAPSGTGKSLGAVWKQQKMKLLWGCFFREASVDLAMKIKEQNLELLEHQYLGAHIWVSV